MRKPVNTIREESVAAWWLYHGLNESLKWNLKGKKSNGRRKKGTKGETKSNATEGPIYFNTPNKQRRLRVMLFRDCFTQFGKQPKGDTE